MIVTALAVAAITIGLLTFLDAVVAIWNRRPAEPLILIVAGVIGVMFFFALYAAGMMV